MELPHTTFYGLPHRRTFAAWRARVPPGFRFAVKANRYITHVKRLRDPAASVGRFLRAAAGLGPALGPLLFQLPGAWHADAGRLSGLAEYIGRQQILPGAQVALEVRHGSWLAPQALSLLERFGWALCLADWPELPVEGPVTAPFVYACRHGPGARYASGYSPAALERDARRVKGWLAEGRQVYVYFNNDAQGYAVRDAAALGRLLGEGAAWRVGAALDARRRAG